MLLRIVEWELQSKTETDHKKKQNKIIDDGSRSLQSLDMNKPFIKRPKEHSSLIIKHKGGGGVRSSKFNKIHINIMLNFLLPASIDKITKVDSQQADSI